jgi:hypothetical protein
LRQHEVERALDQRKLGRAERALAPGRRKARGDEQRILLAERQIEHRREAQHHVAARCRARDLQEADVTLGDVRRVRELELRHGAALAPPAQSRGEASIRIHDYLLRS